MVRARYEDVLRQKIQAKGESSTGGGGRKAKRETVHIKPFKTLDVEHQDVGRERRWEVEEKKGKVHSNADLVRGRESSVRRASKLLPLT